MSIPIKMPIYRIACTDRVPLGGTREMTTATTTATSIQTTFLVVSFTIMHLPFVLTAVRREDVSPPAALLQNRRLNAKSPLRRAGKAFPEKRKREKMRGKTPTARCSL
jgi:hypothetical protein